MNVSDAVGAQLDWMVAKCESVEVEYINDGITRCLLRVSPFTGMYRPSTDWAVGGQLIEREEINLFKHNKLSGSQPDTWCAHKVVPRPNLEGSFNYCALAPEGPTPLIAACRCYVAATLGDEVDVPDELV